jgi:hypothetical protein
LIAPAVVPLLLDDEDVVIDVVETVVDAALVVPASTAVVVEVPDGAAAVPPQPASREKPRAAGAHVRAEEILPRRILSNVIGTRKKCDGRAAPAGRVSRSKWRFHRFVETTKTLQSNKSNVGRAFFFDSGASTRSENAPVRAAGVTLFGNL